MTPAALPHSPEAPNLPVYHRIASTLEHQIESGHYAPGQRLPSIRELCEQYGVADLTVKRALRRLAARGVTQAIAGSGTFVRRASAPVNDRRRLSTVGFVYLGTPPRPIYQYEINRIQNTLRELGHPMFYAAVESDEQLPEAQAHLIEAGAGCLIVMPRQGQHDTPMPGRQLVSGAKLPTLVLESASDQHPFIRTDVEHSSRLLVRHLYDLGHRRIALATRYQPKIEGARSAMTQINDSTLAVDFIPACVGSHQEMIDAGRAVIARRPTAVIACNELMADVMIEQFEMQGLTIPRDISIASYDDHPDWLYRSRVPLTAVHHPCELIAEEVGAWAHERLTTTSRGNRRFQRVITGSLIIRDSTVAVV